MIRARYQPPLLAKGAMRGLLSCAFMAMLFTPVEASADDCGFMGRILDVCKMARDAGREAAIEMAKGMDVATLNARELTNQFGALVADLNGKDPVRASRARNIFEGVLGRSLKTGEVPSLQLSVQLVAKAGTTLDVDTYVFSRDDNAVVKKLFDNDKTSFNARRLNASPIEPFTDAVVRKRIEEAARKFTAPNKPMPKQCASLLNPGSANRSSAYLKCRSDAEAQELADLILLLQGTPAALPITSRHADLAPGGVVAILAPKRQLDALAKLNPSPQLQLWVHDTDSPDKPTVRFRDPVSKQRTPISIQLTELQGQDRCFQTNKIYGTLCFVWVPLRLESIAELPQ
jgi:hypothetical protein